MKNTGKFHGIAKTIVENSFYDKETNTLFTSNPGISFEVLKNLSKKHNFTIGKTKSGEFVSIPIANKYNSDEDFISLYDDFINTYTYYNQNYDTLLSAYKTFDLMDENLAEVGLMLDTYTSEVLAQGFVNNPLKIKITNKDAQTLIEKIFYKNRIYQRLPNLVRSIAKYGNYGLTLSYPYLENWMADGRKDNKFKKIDVLEDLLISFINPKYFKVNIDEYYNPITYETEISNTFVSKNQASALDHKVWQPWQFVHFLIPDEITEPYGKSLLWSMRSAFDQLTSLEALLAVSRASKIQRLVFYIPLPNGINLVDAYGYMNEFKSHYLNSIFTDQGSTKGGRKIPGAMSVLTLPKAHDGEKVDVDHIESNIDLSSVEDVDYFLDKILRNSKLPKGYLVGEDVITTAQTLEAQDLKLKRTLIPLKQALLDGILVLIENILTHAGYNVNNLNVEVSLNEPIQVSADTISKYSDIGQLLSSFIEINNEMTDINKFQFLVKLGMPSDLASLVCSKVSFNDLPNSDELGNFLKNQKAKNIGLNNTTDDESMDESIGMKVSSKSFLNEKIYLKEDFNFLSKLAKKDITDDLIEYLHVKSKKEI